MIDRRTVISRHDPLYTKPHKEAPLSVGNGVFCFTADCTGLQTFYDEYAAPDDAFPLCTYNGRVGAGICIRLCRRTRNNLPLNECKPVSQKLSLWEGVLRSEFTLKGETIKTITFVHPDEDTLMSVQFCPCR